MLILVDTNVLLRMVKADDADHAVAVQALKWLKDHGHRPTIVPQCAYEFYVVVTRSLPQNGLGLEPIAAMADVEEMLCLFPMFRQEEGIFDFWKSLVTQHVVRGKTAHDARLVAAMQRHDVSHLLTFNESDFGRFAPEITVLNPKRVVANHFTP